MRKNIYFQSFIFLCELKLSFLKKSPFDFSLTQMPETSYFGFEKPYDKIRWRQAQSQANRGEQVLLSKVLKFIQSPYDLWHGDVTFKMIHRWADGHISDKSNQLNEICNNLEGSEKAQVVLFGYNKFDRPGHEGKIYDGEDMHLESIIRNKNYKLPCKIVAIGRMNENFGYLSTYFLNRTSPSSSPFSLGNVHNPFEKGFTSVRDQLKHFLDDDNLLMMVVNQHHNTSHPKVISLPLGIQNPLGMWKVMQRAIKIGVKKSLLLYAGGSNWGFRPEIRDCIRNEFGKLLETESKTVGLDQFRMRLVSSMAVVALPGFGYDTYRLWYAYTNNHSTY